MGKRRVSRFCPKYLEQEIGGVPNKLWLRGDSTHPDRGLCFVCASDSQPLGCSFKVAEGYTAISKHAKSKKHIQMFQVREADPNGNNMRQIDMQESLEKARQKNKGKEDLSKKLLYSQTLLANTFHSHNCNSEMFSCFNGMVAELFPDSEIAKSWSTCNKGLGRTKGDYFGQHGIAPFLHNSLVSKLRTTFFSIGFDESSINSTTQLDVNVSYMFKNKVVKEFLESVEMKEGTSAEEIVHEVFKIIDENLIPETNVVTISTDGCSTMIGRFAGVHALMRKRLLWLPDWGGCMAHSPSNMLKAATSCLGESFIKSVSSLHTYLQSQSLHRWRSYKMMSSELGLEPSAIPKMLAVRFRVIAKLANWLLRDDECVYAFIEELAERVKSGDTLPTETEMVLLEHYYGNYVETMLSARFVSDISAPIIAFIDFFENQSKARIHKRVEETVSFLYLLLSKFLKNGGLGDAVRVTPSRILKVKVSDTNLHLDDKELWLGAQVDKFLKEANLSRQSEEVQPWIKSVREFYIELVTKAIKYFTDGLQSKTLQYCCALDPNSCITWKLDDLKTKFCYLAVKFPNIIPEDEVPALLAEMAILKSLPGLEEHLDSSPEDFWFKLSTVEGGTRFKRVPKLAMALLSIFNSNSASETDFSIQNSLVGDARRNRCTQARLNMRMRIKTNVFKLRSECDSCIKRENKLVDDEEEEEGVNDEEETKTTHGRLKHCHCSLFRPSPELMEFMSEGQPKQRYKDQQRHNQLEANEAKRYLTMRRELQKEGSKREKMLKRAVVRLKDLREKKAQNKAKEPKEAKQKEEPKAKRKRLAKEREDKKKEKMLRLSFL